MNLNIDAIREETKESGYRASWIAERIGVDRSTVTRFLNGQTRLGKPALILLMQVLKIKPESEGQTAS